MAKPPLASETLQQLGVGGGGRERNTYTPNMCIDIYLFSVIFLVFIFVPPPRPPITSLYHN